MGNDFKDVEKKDKHILLNIFIILFLILIVCFLYARYISTTGLIVKEYKVSSNKIPENFNGVKIVHISEIHYGSTTFMKDIKRLVKKVNEIEPDLIVFTGDLIDEAYKINDKVKTELTTELSKLDNNLGKYAVYGEEDVTNESFNIIMKDSGFTILNNSYDLIYNKGLTPIYLGGTASSLSDVVDLDKTFAYYKKDKKGVYDPPYKIILTHEGDNASDIISYDKDTDLILAGHSHNGQIVIPFYGGVYIPEGSQKYNAPHYEISGTNIYISSGIGTSIFNYRFLNKPSINLYRLSTR